MKRNVTKCVCHNVSLETLKSVALEVSASCVEELQEHVEFGNRCHMCVSYVDVMLRTGKTNFKPGEQESD